MNRPSVRPTRTSLRDGSYTGQFRSVNPLDKNEVRQYSQQKLSEMQRSGRMSSHPTLQQNQVKNDPLLSNLTQAAHTGEFRTPADPNAQPERPNPLAAYGGGGGGLPSGGGGSRGLVNQLHPDAAAANAAQSPQVINANSLGNGMIFNQSHTSQGHGGTNTGNTQTMFQGTGPGSRPGNPRPLIQRPNK